jgi:hypothetical protein
VHTPLDVPFRLDVVLREDLVDIMIEGRQCFLATFPPFENPGTCFTFAVDAEVTFRAVEADV